MSAQILERRKPKVLIGFLSRIPLFDRINKFSSAPWVQRFFEANASDAMPHVHFGNRDVAQIFTLTSVRVNSDARSFSLAAIARSATHIILM